MRVLKVAVVTGAAFGKAIPAKFLGARVAMAYINVDLGQAVTASLQSDAFDGFSIHTTL